MNTRGLAALLAISVGSSVFGDPFVAVGQTNGVGQVNLHNPMNGALLKSFFAYGGSYTGGVFVATGDVNCDGMADIVTGAGSGGGPHVKVFDGNTGFEIQSFFAYAPTFTGGVRVATGDVNGDGHADIITGSGPGSGGHVKVFSGTNGAVLQSFFAFPAYTGGIFVAATDQGVEKTPNLVVGSDGTVAVFSSTGAPIQSFFAYTSAFTGGVRVASGDVNGDGVDDILTGVATGSPPHVKVFDGKTSALIHSFFAFGPGFAGGVSVAGGDINADGKADMFGGTANTNGTLCIFNGANGSVLNAFTPFGGAHSGGLDVGYGRNVVGNALSIRSANPSGNVPITVYTADLYGNKNGLTTMSRLYAPGVTASLNAPLNVGGQYFDRWELDGSPATNARTVSVLMNAFHIIQAIYLAGRTLSVLSTNPSSGVPITVYQTDEHGNRNGVTPFDRIYTQGTTVSLTAPPLVGSNYFLRWDLGGNPWLAQKTVSLPLGGSNRVLNAVYATGYLLTVLSNQANVLIKSWTPDKAGRGDGTTQFERVYAPNASASFTAPPSINAIPFRRWLIDGNPQTDLKRTVTVVMVTPRIIEAVYE